MNPRKRNLLRQRAIESKNKSLTKEIVAVEEPVTPPVAETAEILKPKPERKRRAYKKRKNITPEAKDA